MAASGPAARGPAERVDNADRARIVLAGAGPGITVAIKPSERSVSWREASIKSSWSAIWAPILKSVAPRTAGRWPICGVATSESWKDKTTGERREKTEWHRVVIFNENLCRIAEQYLKKGSKVFIEGQLQTRKWQDQSGQDRYSTEVVLQGFRGELTLLDRAGAAGAGGAGGGEFGAEEGGGEFGSSGPTRKVAAAAGAARGPARRHGR